MPDVLYHYTSLDSLALILSNRTIRFARLDTLDDPQEQRLSDARNLARTRFVSCWTACAEESIPMWREYAGADCGVRVELPVDPFARYRWTPEDIERVTGLPCKDSSNGELAFPEAIVPFEELWDRGLYVLESAGKTDILHKVEYTDDRERLFPKTLSLADDGALSINHGEIGLRKASPWAYQDEWRYILSIMPLDMKSGSFDAEGMLSRLSAFLTDCGEAHTPLCYDLRISDSAFASMRVTASPRISAGNRVILSALLDKYNPKAELISSHIEL